MGWREGETGASIGSSLIRGMRQPRGWRLGLGRPSSRGRFDMWSGARMMSITSFSEAGGHADNEDAFVLVPHPSGPDRWLCSLADGRGGQAGGADAARIACRTAAEAEVRRPMRALQDPDVWIAILREADRAVSDAPEA